MTANALLFLLSGVSLFLLGTGGGFGLVPGSSAGVGGLGQGSTLPACTGTLFGQQTPGEYLLMIVSCVFTLFVLRYCFVTISYVSGIRVRVIWLFV